MSIEVPQVASAAWPPLDAALLAGAVVLRFPGSGADGVLAVPSGPGRLGGSLEVPRPVVAEVAQVLAALPRFENVRAVPDGRGGVRVVWGASCPARISGAGRRRFYRGAATDWTGGSPAAGMAGPLALRDAVTLDALAHGTPVGTLIACGLAADEREVHERLVAAGEVLTGWRGMTWTALVHAAVCRGVVPAVPARPVSLGPAGLALLNAWASGAPRIRSADLAGGPGALRELERSVCERLGARSEPHAVLRGHEAGLLGPGEPGAERPGWSRGP
ncbi:DUF6302 family protein [Streptomyces amakusaensis]|uniref:DUF6302 family protein n=1 Tax=Streptomyces amakusaensis TaxID=67271 RepID=A0ABW0AQ30_9ACTN